MIRILNSSLELQAILDDILPNPRINEEINREFTFSFSTLVDEEKSKFITSTSIIEVENNFFQIGLLEKKRDSDGLLLIDLDCEHVSYQLLDDSVEFFTADGTPEQILTVLLTGTNFTLGDVEITDVGTVSIQEETNKRDILIGIAEAFSGELEFDKFTIHLRTRRGVDNGVHFRVGKNLRGVIRIVDNRDKDALGNPKFAFGVDIVELSELEEFGALETIRLGDTVQIIDADLDINESSRVVRYEFDPLQKRNSKVDISNFVDNITDRVLKIERQSLVKETIYNGIRIGPEDGFEAIRSDNLARTVMNATEGIKIQKGDGTGTTWTDVIFLDVNGNAVFTGTVQASDFVGGTIDIGTGAFTVDNLGNITVTKGSIDLGGGVFTVDNAGNMVATSGQFTGTITASDIIGGTIAIGSLNNIFKADSNGIYLGNATFGSAPFRVSMSGALTATNGNFTGNITSSAITGTTLTGGTVRTASSGARIELSGNALKTFNSAGNLSGFVWGDEGSPGTFGDAFLFSGGSKAVEFFDQGGSFSIRGASGSSGFLLGGSVATTAEGSWTFTGSVNFSSATVSGLSTDTAPNHNHGITPGRFLETFDSAGNSLGLQVWNASGSHSHTVS